MKLRKPTIPEGAPEGTIWSGGPIEWFSITLRIMGKDLDPDEITQVLGCPPNAVRVSRHGGWRLTLKPTDTDEWDCGEAMLELLQRLPSDVGIWQALAARLKIDFFVGLTMASKNKGFSLSPKVMSYLAERGIEAGFDIYYEPIGDE